MKEAIKRGLVVGFGLILQFLLTLFFYLYLIDKILIINILFTIIKIIIIISLIKNNNNYSLTLPWIIILLLFPVIGSLMYIILFQSKNNSKLLKKIKASEKTVKKYLKQDNDTRQLFVKDGQLRYISDYVGFPVSNNNDVTYYPYGELAFDAMLSELKKAKKFIFLEYFIINFGTMWNNILDVLESKVKEGVEVRVIYDDAGCIATLPKNYEDILNQKGIKCVAFNKLNPISGVIINNRDHRKILIIDGILAFSGGINLSDEYINIGSNYGVWKDNAFKVSGDAVWNYTVMFLTIWNVFFESNEDFNNYKHLFEKKNSKGLCVAYSDSPLDDELTGENIYLNIINQAKNYVYIFTPYLIIDTNMINALILAAKRGVDVRIVIPGIPDKKIVYTLSESYLQILVNGGVKIYKYTSGFVHSKVFLADDNIATIGTINLDYRSLYLHFECGLYLKNMSCLKDIKQDFNETIEKSHLISRKEATPKFLKAIWQTILRLFAPLM